MSNRSLETRTASIKFLEQLRNTIEPTIDTKESQDFNEKINSIENQLLEKRFGLYWDDHDEDMSKVVKNNFVVLEKDESRSMHLSDENYNFFIEGDNLHALHLLLKTHRRSIDIIYIDPPYNTGGKTFKYNDDYVDANDNYKHSKWLSFMSERLEIAHQLMSSEGVIYVSIDDNEYSQLKILMDSIFGEDNFVVTLPRQTKKSGKTTDAFARNHDYLLVYSNSKNVFLQQENPSDQFKQIDEHVETRGKYRVNQTLDYDSLQYSPSLDYPIEIEGYTLYPGGDYQSYMERKSGNYNRADWAWRWSKDLYEFGLANDFIVLKTGRDGKPRLYTKTYEKAKIVRVGNGKYEIDYKDSTVPMSSLELTKNAYSNDNAKKDLKRFGLKENFDYPKPVELIKKLIMTHKNKDAIVLDFFAGSATTAEAVIEANETDGGNRKFILSTNDEGNIASEIAYPRIKKIFKGYETIGKHSVKLHEEKITIASFKKMDKIMSEVDSIIEDNRHKYDKIRKSFKNNILSVIGENNKGTTIPGTSSNMIYYKIGMLPKNEENAESILLNYITPLIELEYSVNMANNSMYKLLLTEQHLDDYMEDTSEIPIGAKLFIPHHVLVTNEQKKIIEDLELSIIRIPDYYYINELLEIGAL